MEKKGNIGVTTENIFPVIKQFLYSDHEIFLREMVSNAVDATQKMKTLASAGDFSGDLGDLSVRVTLDEQAGTLTISDRGIGMTAEEIDKYINQIAFSGVTDFLDKYKDKAEAIIGHFGLGFYSAFMVSKKVEIVTKSWRDGSQAVRWTCDGSPEYTIDEVEKADRGSDIILHIDDDSKDYLQKSTIEQLLTKYCKFMAVPVVFGKKTEWKDGKQVDTDEDNVINSVEPLWPKSPSSLKDEDYKKYVCVEPGFVRSHCAVKPHHQFALKQRITVEEKWCVSFTNKANLWFRPIAYSMWDCFLVERAIFSSFFSCSRRCL